MPKVKTTNFQGKTSWEAFSNFKLFDTTDLAKIAYFSS